jgi:hypothetical protein
MNNWKRGILGGVIVLALPGCVAKTAYDVATAPVRVGAKAVDLTTTSQAEADRKRGRELRQREARLGKLQRRYDDQMAKCQHGNRDACSAARVTYGEIGQIAPTVPVEPR